MPLRHPRSKRSKVSKKNQNIQQEAAESAAIVDKVLRSVVGSLLYFELSGTRGQRILGYVNAQLAINGTEIVQEGPGYRYRKKEEKHVEEA